MKKKSILHIDHSFLQGINPPSYFPSPPALLSPQLFSMSIPHKIRPQTVGPGSYQKFPIKNHGFCGAGSQVPPPPLIIFITPFWQELLFPELSREFNHFNTALIQRSQLHTITIFKSQTRNSNLSKSWVLYTKYPNPPAIFNPPQLGQPPQLF